MQNPSKTVLKTQDVTKTYTLSEDNIINAVRGVSLEIKSGEFVSIVGKSGSGKSTLMHIIGLLDTPTSGEVVVNGKNAKDMNEKQLAQLRNEEIGFVFQSFNLLKRTSALENVILPLAYSDVPKSQWKQKGTEMLKLVELGDRLDNKSNELSGGQKQRVAIARALINDPSIVLADEPTGNLDTRTGDEIVELFRRLNEAGKTVVIVTHDEDLSKVADRQIIISDGQIVAEERK